jgi:hypothetical protein
MTKDLTKYVDLSASYVPSYGSTILIRSSETGHLHDGHITLASPNSRGSTIWHCVESDGWLRFRNKVTGKFLCHCRGDPRLYCSAKEGTSLRHFTITPVSGGGNGRYILQMADWWTLRPVVVFVEAGVQRLGRTGDKLADGEVWEFVRVGEGKD